MPCLVLRTFVQIKTLSVIQIRVNPFIIQSPITMFDIVSRCAKDTVANVQEIYQSQIVTGET
jgi:hypothetical protein